MARRARRSREFPRDLMTVAQVADYLQLNRLTVYRYIRDGRLSAVNLGRSIRILKEDVYRFLEEQKVAPGGARRPVARARISARPAGQRQSTRVPVKHSDEIYVGPPREERAQPREAVITSNPLEWVIRGLH